MNANIQTPIVIACVNNDAYTALTVVMLKSLIMNYRGLSMLHIYVLHNGVSKSNQKKIECASNSSKVVLYLIYINEDLLRQLNISNIYSRLQIHYYKLLIPYVLPQDITRAIFLDSDMVVLEDIDRLWKTDLEDAVLAAAQDARLKVVSNDQAIRNYKELGIAPDTRYFNTGLMVMDLFKWRANDISMKALECFEANKEYVYNTEQYILNIILLNAWKELDARWNQFPETNHPAAYIYHYSGWWTKTLDENYKNNLPKEFFYYAKRTPWGCTTVKNEIERKAFVRKIKVSVVKVLRKLRIKNNLSGGH